MNEHLQNFNCAVLDYHQRGVRGKEPGQSLSDWVNDLARQYSTTRMQVVREKLVLSNSRCAGKRVMSCYRRRMIRDSDLMDVFHEVLLAIGKAADRFDSALGNKFLTYAMPYIVQATMRYAQDNKRMVRANKHSTFNTLVVKIMRESAKSLALTGEDLDEQTIDRILKSVSITTRAAIVDMLNGSELEFLDGFHSVHDVQNDHAERELINKIDAQSIVDAGGRLKKLSAKERAILETRILTDNEFTLQELGDQFGVTRERIRQIESQLIRKIKRQLAA